MAGKKSSRGDSVGQEVPGPEKKTVTFSQAKAQLKQMVERTDHDNISDDKAEIAIEVIEENKAANQPMQRAFIAEHLFRRTIEEAIPCGIAAVDHFGKQIYVNRTFCAMLGWDENKLLGASYPYVYWDKNDIEQFQGSYLHIVEGALKKKGIELPFLRKDGGKFWGWVLGSVLYNSDGESVGHLFSIVDISEKKEAQDALKQFSVQLVDAREKERQLISRDLHDSIGGRLAGIKYGLEKIIRTVSVDTGNIAGPLNNLLQVVKSAIDETRRISKNLHPSVLDDLGLKAALRDLVREFKVLYPAIAISCSLEFDDGRLPDQLKILVYRVCQEALTNIGKHSRATRGDLQLKLTKAEVILTVRDNGIGFCAGPSVEKSLDRWRFGLLGIRERIDLAGGRLEVWSEKGKGVHIQALWPVS